MRVPFIENLWVSKIAILTILMLMVFSCSESAHTIKVQLVADADRNGKVQFEKDDQVEWSSERGAIFFNNNDSDQNTRTPDHADTVINGKEDLKDLTPLILKRISDLPADAQVTISVDEISMDRVHLFVKVAEDKYEFVDITTSKNIDPALLKHSDLELRIEANSYADRDWNGETEIVITVKTIGGEIKRGSVKLKVAPFILLSNINRGKTVYVRKYPGKNDAFIKKLSEVIPQTGAELYIISEEEPHRDYGLWLQDTMEIGCSEKPGQRMNVVLKANRDESLDNFARDKLLGPDYGWIQVGIFRERYGNGEEVNDSLDWYGNLEATPPFLGYPLGRIYYGFNPDGPEDASLNPEIVTMLEAQEVQAPALRLDTGWLFIKHVDEFISFIPSGNSEYRYKVLVVDPATMIALLEKWMNSGYGKTRILGKYSKVATVATLLNNEGLIKHNKYLQRERIEPNIDLLKKELGLREEDFIRVPAFFNKWGSSIVPNMVNSLIVNGHILIPAPNGPIIDGKDQMEEEIRKLLSGLPLILHFVDDRQYHKSFGNVHCATNVRRVCNNLPWWKGWKKSPSLMQSNILSKQKNHKDNL